MYRFIVRITIVPSIATCPLIHNEGMRPSLSLGILYEHPEWFSLLFGELDRRNIPWAPLHAESLLFDPERPVPHALVVNRMSPSSHRRGHGNGIFTVRDYLSHLEENGVAVVNGSAAYA